MLPDLRQHVNPSKINTGHVRCSMGDTPADDVWTYGVTVAGREEKNTKRFTSERAATVAMRAEVVRLRNLNGAR